VTAFNGAMMMDAPMDRAATFVGLAMIPWKSPEFFSLSARKG